MPRSSHYWVTTRALLNGALPSRNTSLSSRKKCIRRWRWSLRIIMLVVVRICLALLGMMGSMPENAPCTSTEPTNPQSGGTTCYVYSDIDHTLCTWPGKGEMCVKTNVWHWTHATEIKNYYKFHVIVMGHIRFPCWNHTMCHIQATNKVVWWFYHEVGELCPGGLYTVTPKKENGPYKLKQMNKK